MIIALRKVNHVSEILGSWMNICWMICTNSADMVENIKYLTFLTALI